jgi:predicted metal-binding membrane protein
VLKRDRLIVGGALALLTALAWAYVLWLARAGMPEMAMPAMKAMAPALAPWGAREFLLAFAMWAVMMVGMMTPSVAPMVLLYARVGRQAEAQGESLAATAWFAGGYLAAWTVFALLAAAAQLALTDAAALSPMLRLRSAALGGAVLIAAGAYQWTALKAACLANCQSPLAFIQRHGGFRASALGALGLGARHGAYCVGCCWALMTLLFVGGVMNLLWIAGLAILVLVEKITPFGQRVPRAAGLALGLAGAYLVATALG